MSDIIKERLELILESINLIEKRITGIATPLDLLKDDLLMDALAMRLQSIGENFKKIDKIDSTFLPENGNIDPVPIIRFRDFITHHYEKTDYEIIFDICKWHLPVLKQKIEAIIFN